MIWYIVVRLISELTKHQHFVKFMRIQGKGAEGEREKKKLDN